MKKIIKLLFFDFYKKLETIEEMIIDSKINVFFYVEGKLLQGVSMKVKPPIDSIIELNLYGKSVFVKVNSIRLIDYKSDVHLNCEIEIDNRTN